MFDFFMVTVSVFFILHITLFTYGIHSFYHSIKMINNMFVICFKILYFLNIFSLSTKKLIVKGTIIILTLIFIDLWLRIITIYTRVFHVFGLIYSPKFVARFYSFSFLHSDLFFTRIQYFSCVLSGALFLYTCKFPIFCSRWIFSKSNTFKVVHWLI